MFIVVIYATPERRSEEREASQPFTRRPLPAPPNGAGGLVSASYKHATPSGVSRCLPH